LLHHWPLSRRSVSIVRRAIASLCLTNSNTDALSQQLRAQSQEEQQQQLSQSEQTTRRAC
jgi:hypothetical protein